MQHYLSYDVSLFDPAMCLDDVFEEKHLGPQWDRSWTNRDVQPFECLTGHFTIKGQIGMIIEVRCGFDAIRISKGRLCLQV